MTEFRAFRGLVLASLLGLVAWATLLGGLVRWLTR